MKYCDGLDCAFCDEKEPCIYRRANKLQECIDEIEEIVNKYKVGSGNLYGTICIPDVIRIAEKIKEVKGNG